MRILHRSTASIAQPTKMDCHKCKSTVEIEQGEWRKGTYGSEQDVSCIVCGAGLVKPGTEYTGDF